MRSLKLHDVYARHDTKRNSLCTSHRRRRKKRKKASVVDGGKKRVHTIRFVSTFSSSVLLFIFTFLHLPGAKGTPRLSTDTAAARSLAEGATEEGTSKASTPPSTPRCSSAVDANVDDGVDAAAAAAASSSARASTAASIALDIVGGGGLDAAVERPRSPLFRAINPPLGKRNRGGKRY